MRTHEEETNEMTTQIFLRMLTTISTEQKERRHPHVKVLYRDAATKKTTLEISSDQIKETLELTPKQLVDFRKALGKNCALIVEG